MFKKVFVLSLMATAVYGCETAPPQVWTPRSKFADPLYPFVKHAKVGYIDGSGAIVIPASLRAYGEFHDGLMKIFADGQYIDRSGKAVIDQELSRGWEFSEGLAFAVKKGGKLWGFIDTSGKFAIPPRFESSPNGYVPSFSEGLAMIEVRGKFGYIDRTGEFVIQPTLLDGIGFSDGAARVVTEGPCVYFPDGDCGSFNPRFPGGVKVLEAPSCKFTYIDKKENRIGQSTFDAGRDFSEGLAPVKVGKLWGFIDKSGAVVIPAKFEDAEPYSSGLSRIKKGDLYGYINKLGEIAIPPRYECAENFSEGFAVVGDVRDHVWYIDSHGNRTIPSEFSAASSFFKGLADVRMLPRAGSRTARFAYIDKTGRRVFTY